MRPSTAGIQWMGRWRKKCSESAAYLTLRPLLVSHDSPKHQGRAGVLQRTLDAPRRNRCRGEKYGVKGANHCLSYYVSSSWGRRCHQRSKPRNGWEMRSLCDYRISRQVVVCIFVLPLTCVKPVEISYSNYFYLLVSVILSKSLMMDFLYRFEEKDRGYKRRIKSKMEPSEWKKKVAAYFLAL